MLKDDNLARNMCLLMFAIETFKNNGFLDLGNLRMEMKLKTQTKPSFSKNERETEWRHTVDGRNPAPPGMYKTL